MIRYHPAINWISIATLMATFVPQTILELGRQYNISLPAQSPRNTDSPTFRLIAIEPDLVSFRPNLTGALKFSPLLMPCRRVAFENIEDAARHGLHYVELLFFTSATWQWHISCL